MGMSLVDLGEQFVLVCKALCQLCALLPHLGCRISCARAMEEALSPRTRTSPRG